MPRKKTEAMYNAAGIHSFASKPKGGSPVPSKFDPQEGVGKKTWEERKKITTYLEMAHFISLKQTSEALQIPIGRLIDQALNEYLSSLGVQSEPAALPIDKDAMRAKLKKVLG